MSILRNMNRKKLIRILVCVGDNLSLTKSLIHSKYL